MESQMLVTHQAEMQTAAVEGADERMLIDYKHELAESRTDVERIKQEESKTRDRM